MHIGRILVCESSSSTAVFSEWTSRQADNGVFTLELIQAMNGADISVTLYHKNSEESGDGAAKAVIKSGATAAGLYSATISDLKELVRYRIEITTEQSGLGAVLYRMLPVTWMDTAIAP